MLPARLQFVERGAVVEGYFLALADSFDARHEPDFATVAKHEAVGLAAVVVGVTRLVAADRAVDVLVLIELEDAVLSRGDAREGDGVGDHLALVLDDLDAPGNVLGGKQTHAVYP